ncbi:CRISPR-associated protein, Cse3 family [Rubellimicrobium thermophilum DSM 16684]|uniref:CRISPR-associated protein, Cse3 family n=1 Tax=Rubellimicrobium thermophilum DSM 16684 TaxID=1123069 RepID=S9SDP8_9RHOB|nr:type I-E CRISPR-associated protein Cas6/Cse3/CasE [Rubellimicrobium thermophilum]EPX84374.1 CRISPR-associated protein, Cse3 family [Rubellimicrobium thermophilum DSM 16684]
MFLSRLTLKRSPDVAALGRLLDPKDPGRRMDAQHRLIWSAFAGDPEARRDFLWRDMGGGTFLVLSPRPPGESALFERADATPFAPDLAAGDRLAFVLRANATRTVTEPDGRKRHRDVVMEALHATPKGARAPVRLERAQEAGRRWLEGQGARAGFRVTEAGVTAYAVAEPPGQGARRPRFGIIDLEGLIEVTDPAAFLARLAQGFGRAKAFGCGLMLIRRA